MVGLGKGSWWKREPRSTIRDGVDEVNDWGFVTSCSNASAMWIDGSPYEESGRHCTALDIAGGSHEEESFEVEENPFYDSRQIEHQTKWVGR